jgi:hypothetical protein
MPGPTSEEEIYREARRRVQAKKGFYVHLAVYLAVNALLVAIWATSPGRHPWFLWPALGWGIGLAFHALGAFRFQTGWERAQVEREAERLRRERGSGEPRR